MAQIDKATEEKIKRLLLRLHRLHANSFHAEPTWWNAFRQTATDVDDLLRTFEPSLAPEACCKQEFSLPEANPFVDKFVETYIG